MLLSCGKGQHKSPFPVQVFGLANQTSRQAAHVIFPGREHPEPWSTERAGNTEALTFAARNVRALSPGVFQETVGKGLCK